MSTYAFHIEHILLDISVVRFFFDKHFKDPKAYDRWQAILKDLQNNHLENVEFQSFDALALKALYKLAHEKNNKLIDMEIKYFNTLISQLPLKEEPMDFIQSIKEKGIRIIGYTHASGELFSQWIDAHRLDDIFESLIKVRTYHPEAFHLDSHPGTTYIIHDKELLTRYQAAC